MLYINILAIYLLEHLNVFFLKYKDILCLVLFGCRTLAQNVKRKLRIRIRSWMKSLDLETFLVVPPIRVGARSVALLNRDGLL